MLEKAKKILSDYINGQTSVAVGVSGGEDSMCLLSLVLSCSFICRDRITVLNVDHKMRDNSADDSAFVREFCEREKIKFVSYVRDVPALCAEKGLNGELAARNVRRDIFTQWAESGAVEYVLTAHHALDQTETLLLHLFRGSGLKGLCGMKVLSEGKILRPLLTTDKEEIRAYIKQSNLPFVTDDSNFDTRYDRNFIRRDILPLVASRWGGLTRRISATCEILSDYYDCAERITPYGLIEKTDECVRIDCKAFDESSAVSANIIVEAMRLVGRANDVEYKHIQSIKSLAHMQNGKRTDLGGNVTAVKEYGFVTLYAPREKESGETVPFAIGDMLFASLIIHVAKVPPFPVKGKLIFDSDKVPKGAVIRFRREGDVFKPYGSGSKKLKKYFIDEKIPARIRDKIPCLCYNNKILAVLDYEISDDIKVDTQTRSAVQAEVLRKNDAET